MRPKRRLILGGAFATLALAWGCADETPPDPLTESVIELFALAHDGEPDAARVERLFDVRADERWRATLYDALSQLARVSTPQVVGVEPLEDVGRTAVDVTAGLPGGGEARFALQLEAREDGGWRVVTFDGPGVSWPPRDTQRGPGTSTRPES